MKGEIINCGSHKDIYFLETNMRNECTDLANMFTSAASKEMYKDKSRTKLKQKLTPAINFFIHNSQEGLISNTEHKVGSTEKCQENTAGTSRTSNLRCRSRRSSIDLYEEAASILGLTCQQTDDCKCLECQCHYFDFEEDMDYDSTECLMDENSSCCIQ